MNEKNNNLNIMYLTTAFILCHVVCCVLFFRKIEFNFFTYKFETIGAAFFFPFTYVICDLIILISDRMTAVIAILFGIICEGVFTFLIYYVSFFKIPINISNHSLMLTNAINLLGSEIWRLFYQSLFASIVSLLLEIYIFSYLYKKISNFVISTLISIFITILCHNLVNDYEMFQNEVNIWKLIFNTLIINMVIISIYVFIAYFIFKMNVWRKPYLFCIDFFNDTYNKFIKNIENRALDQHELSLKEKRLFIDENDQPFFYIIDLGNKSSKLFINDLIVNSGVYENKFSKKDCEIMITEAMRAIIEKYKLEKDLVNLAGKVVHDIGSPLLAMRILIENLKNDVTADLLKENIDNINDIINSLIEPYRALNFNANNNSSNLEMQKVSLFELIDNLINLKKIEWSNNPCEIIFISELDNQNSLVNIIPHDIRRQLSNLLNNAYESLGKTNRKIEMGLKNLNNEYIISIKDYGCGIHENDLQLVLHGKSLKHEGKGIGLSSAYNYFKNMNGNLFINSKINEGTCIDVVFPK